MSASDYSSRAAAARNWARKGYWLTPVRLTPEGKVYLRGEKDNGVKWGASNDPDETSAWWAAGSRYADANIGVVTELSGVVCVDLDRGHADGVDGVQGWAALGQEAYPYPAYIDHTPRGGRHLLYRADPARPVKGSAGAVAPGVDTKGIGGMFILYTDALPVMEPRKLPPLPPLVYERAPHQAASSTAPSIPGGQDPFASPARPFTKAQAREWCLPYMDRLRSAPSGTINDTLNTAAKVVYHFVPALLEREAADAWLLDALSSTAYDGRTWKAQTTLDSAWQSSRRDWVATAADQPDPLGAPAGDDPGGAERADLELAAEVARQRRQRDARLLLDAEETARQADDAAVAALTEQLLTSAALDDIPDLEPLIEGWLFRDSMARLIGKSGTYKSFVALDMACHVAAGTEWFGYATGTGPVVYVVAEGARGVRRRVRAWEAKHLESLGDKLLILPRPVQMVGPEWLAFVGACKAVGAVMVVLDTQARVTVGVEENSAREMGQVVAMGERLRVDTGACVMLIHHTGHAGEHGRGSTSVYGALQTELSLERTADRRVCLKASKQKDHDELGPVNLKLEPCCDSLVLVNLDGMDDVSAGTVEESIRSITMASGSHAERAAIVLHGLWRGGSGATRAELRKACAEQYELAGLAALKPTSFTYAFTKMEEAGWLREGRSASRFILSEPGCRHLGVEYVGPMDWDEES